MLKYQHGANFLIFVQKYKVIFITMRVLHVRYLDNFPYTRHIYGVSSTLAFQRMTTFPKYRLNPITIRS